MLQKSGRAIAAALLLGAAVSAWAGKEFPQQAGEQVVPNQLLVKLKNGVLPASVIPLFLSSAQIQQLRLSNHYLVRVPGGIPAAVSAALAAHPLVDMVEPDRVRHAIVAAPNDPDYNTSAQWGLFTVEGQQAWNFLGLSYLTAATAGTGRVKVAVLDTGADCTHPDFVNTGGTSTDSALGGQLLWSGSQALVATTVSSPACAWQDDYGHGTHVSGIIAAATSNAVGVASLGFSLQLLEFKVLDDTGSGSDSTISNAIVAAVGAGAKVISMSFGGSGYSATLQAAINYAWQNNVVVVAAGGNNSTSSLFFPAGASHTIGVAASDSNNNAASFSNFGNDIAVTGPGVSILSTIPTYSVTLGCCNYAYLSGTSMATPFVSALAGLLAETTPNAAADAIAQRIEQTAFTSASGGAWSSSFGYGIVNAYSAVAAGNRSTSTGGVVGQIIDPFGNPAAGAQITVGGQSFNTDSSGLYWLRPLAAGTYNATIAASGYLTQMLTVTVAAGADTPFSVQMGISYGSFTGTVTDQGSAVAGAIVQALSGGAVMGTAVTDATGHYTLWVPGGSYSLQASQVGSTTAAVSSYAVAGGGSTTVNLTLPSLQGTIAGVVQDSNGNAVAGAQVTVSSSVLSATAISNASGFYSVGQLPTGAGYSVAVSASGDTSATQSGIAVSADATTTVNFQLTVLPASAPVFSPPAGTYGSAQSVTITSAPPGVSIRYTTDGSAPSPTAGTPYTGPVTVSSTETLNAVAYSSTVPASPVSTAAYTINQNVWYSNGGSWTNRQQIVINHGQVSGSSSLTNFPVLVSITDANLASTAKADGSDILFTAADGVTKLNHEIEQYNSATGQLVAWVQVPSLSPTADTGLYLYYGNASAAAQQNAAGVWDGNFKGVWHLPNGTVLSAADSTSNGNNGTVSAVTATNGEVGGAASFSGAAGNTIGIGSSSSLRVGGSVSSASWEFWMNPTQTSTYPNSPTLLSYGYNGEGSWMYWIRWSNTWGGGAGRYLQFWLDNDYSQTTLQSSYQFPAGVWTHVVMTYDNTSSSNNFQIYYNGVLTDTLSLSSSAFPSTVTNFAGNLGMGVPGSNALSYAYDGGLDEVRISNAVRPAGWIATEYNNQSAPGTFLTVGAPQNQPLGGGPVAVTVTSVPAGLGLTVDGTGCTAPCSLQWTPGSNHTDRRGLAGGRHGDAVRVCELVGQRGGLAYGDGAVDGRDVYGQLHHPVLPDHGGQPDGGGSIAPGSGWYNAGAVVAVSAAANSGYQFSGFSGALSGSTTPQNLTLNAPAGVTANFTAGGSGSWYSNGGTWTNRQQIVINHGQVSGSSSLTNFPVLVSITDANLASTAKADGSDILFTAADGVTKLNHEIEQYNSATGQLVAWVQVPSLSPTADTGLYLYYGNASAAAQQNAAGVWDGNFKGVWHLPNGTVLSAADSTSNGNNGTVSAVTATNGEVGGAASFSGAAGNTIGIGSSSSLRVGGSVSSASWEFWMNPTQTSTYPNSPTMLSYGYNGEGSWMYWIRWSNTWGGGAGRYLQFWLDNDYSQTTLQSSYQFPAGVWTHVVMTYDNTSSSNNFQIYYNGVLTDTLSLSSSAFPSTVTNFAGNLGMGVPGRMQRRTPMKGAWMKYGFRMRCGQPGGSPPSTTTRARRGRF